MATAPEPSSTADEPGPARPRKDRFAFFPAEHAPSLSESEMMDAPVFVAPDIVQQGDRELLRAGQKLRVLFRHAGPDGFSLVHVSFAPHYPLPRHSHNVDCLYFVVRGEVVLGNRVVSAGEGFFVPKDHPYAYSAGPDGVDLLEFRHATTFDFVVREADPDRWRTIIDIARANQALWTKASGEV
jgi:quercetin dioxygenase-like cupin family protein